MPCHVWTCLWSHSVWSAITFEWHFSPSPLRTIQESVCLPVSSKSSASIYSLFKKSAHTLNKTSFLQCSVVSIDWSRPAGLHCRAAKTAHFKLVITTRVTEFNLAHSFLAELQLWLSSSSLNVSSLLFPPFISSHLPFSFPYLSHPFLSFCPLPRLIVVLFSLYCTSPVSFYPFPYM